MQRHSVRTPMRDTVVALSGEANANLNFPFLRTTFSKRRKCKLYVKDVEARCIDTVRDVLRNWSGSDGQRTVYRCRRSRQQAGLQIPRSSTTVSTYGLPHHPRVASCWTSLHQRSCFFLFLKILSVADNVGSYFSVIKAWNVVWKSR